MNLQAPRTKLLLACALLALLLITGASQGLSIVALSRVALIAALFAGAILWVRSRGRSSSQPHSPHSLRVLSKAGLSPRCSLALVSAEGRQYLVAYGDGFAQIELASAPRRTSRRYARGIIDAGGLS
jgi:flagellar protein FliO/FliZ